MVHHVGEFSGAYQTTGNQILDKPGGCSVLGSLLSGGLPVAYEFVSTDPNLFTGHVEACMA